ncbi:MAG: hypothetical protein DSM106950_04070 [Stigonema ocellatum SAG 48.90 = DSM 106950]|nr:hypothetical protein [Stigonema ocellatum SAG 48.90 = DSM 106950]
MKHRNKHQNKVWIIPRNFVIVDKDNPDIWTIVPNPYWENRQPGQDTTSKQS